jgi:hypothetical protein
MPKEELTVQPDDGFVLVFDCESDCSFTNCPGENVKEKVSKFMQFTTICAATLPTNLILSNIPVDDVMRQASRYHWWRDESKPGQTPIDGLLALFDRADVIVGFNALHFDFPLIRRFYRSVKPDETPTQRYFNHRSKCHDIMARVRDVTDLYYKLDDLLKFNHIPCKTSDGLQAITMWEEQRRQELLDYCAADVDLTARLALLDDISIDKRRDSVCYSVGVRSALLKKDLIVKRKRKIEEEEYVLV